MNCRVTGVQDVVGRARSRAVGPSVIEDVYGPVSNAMPEEGRSLEKGRVEHNANGVDQVHEQQWILKSSKLPTSRRQIEEPEERLSQKNGQGEEAKQKKN